MVTPPRHDRHDLSGVYALDAIADPAERAQFERHLLRCQECATEVRGMSETAARLAFAASRLAPPQLRDRVLAAVSRTRQLPPKVDDHRADTRARLAPRPFLGWIAAAACLVVALGLAFALLHAERQLQQSRSQAAAIASVLTAPDARAVTKHTSTGGTATVVFSLVRHSMVVTTAKLPPLPAGKVYQLWLIGPPHTRSAGLLPAVKHGASPPVVISGVVGGDAFGMTVEPTGGTKQPTTAPMVVVHLAR